MAYRSRGGSGGDQPPVEENHHDDLYKAEIIFFPGRVHVQKMSADTETHGESGRNVVVSWTGGKDGCLACSWAMREGFEVSHLLNFRDAKKQGSHEINPDLLIAQSEATGIPLIRRDFRSYEQEFIKAVRELNRDGAGIEGAVFGHIETHKNLVDRICGELGIEPIMPLWKRDPEQIVAAVIDAGFEVILVSVRADLLGEEWLGRRIDRTFVRDLRRVDPSIDLCGENGEFHTFVTDGPILKSAIRVVDGETVLRGGHWFLDITECAIERKNR